MFKVNNKNVNLFKVSNIKQQNEVTWHLSNVFLLTFNEVNNVFVTNIEHAFFRWVNSRSTTKCITKELCNALFMSPKEKSRQIQKQFKNSERWLKTAVTIATNWPRDRSRDQYFLNLLTTNILNLKSNWGHIKMHTWLQLALWVPSCYGRSFFRDKCLNIVK